MAFNVGADGNIPTIYSFMTLALAATLLAIVAMHPENAARGRAHLAYWWGLSAIFAFLAIDEMIQVHEKLIDPTRDLFATSGLFYYAWVIPYGVFALVVALTYIRFLKLLPRRTAGLFLIAGALYVSGAIGFEMIGGWYWEKFLTTERDATMIALQTVEEGLEMLGIAIFIYAIADYLATHLGRVSVELHPERRAQAAESTTPPKSDAAPEVVATPR